MSPDWPSYKGDYILGNEESRVAILIIGRGTVDLPPDLYRIKGTVKTENLGLEKVVLNIVSNPSIRYLVVCGKEEFGHFPGDAIVSLWSNGLDEDRRIIGAKGAIPYLCSIPDEVLIRFRQQVHVIDLVHPREVEEMVAMDPIYEFEKERRAELIKVLKRLKAEPGADLEYGPMHLEVPGLRQSGEMTARGMHRTADMIIETMLTMPSEALSTKSKFILVSNEFNMGLDPVSGTIFQAPSLKLAEKMKSYFTGD
ncbi:MAG: Tetrahydromethanopterin S-methyltransferase subunit A 1 [Methanomassiliicoccales archaeon PtaU1.Bin124]|nr:MAG: Tetrahydromethanopterin S-methyltransferase subunit A 1 [Methanomassiliicoccales archaeon PtaU1.Bin124]